MERVGRSVTTAYSPLPPHLQHSASNDSMAATNGVHTPSYGGVVNTGVEWEWVVHADGTKRCVLSPLALGDMSLLQGLCCTDSTESRCNQAWTGIAPTAPPLLALRDLRGAAARSHSLSPSLPLPLLRSIERARANPFSTYPVEPLPGHRIVDSPNRTAQCPTLWTRRQRQPPPASSRPLSRLRPRLHMPFPLIHQRIRTSQPSRRRQVRTWGAA